MFCFEEEAPDVFDLSFVVEGCPESRRSVKARSIMGECARVVERGELL
jgi:hypothetical protein